jgi:broad specificity phosphatase PhoE
MTLNLYLMRHGETEASRLGVYTGSTDVDLTSEGLAMAEAFAETYRHLSWQAVFCSPLKRAVSTATPFCQATGLEMWLRDGLKEMLFGEWEGLSFGSVQTQFSDDYYNWMTEPAWNPPTGGETGMQVASRAAAVLAEIEHQFTEGNVLVISHKTTIRLMLCNLLGMDIGRYRDRITMPVASVSLLQFGKYGPMLVKHGDRSHLPTDLEARPGT